MVASNLVVVAAVIFAAPGAMDQPLKEQLTQVSTKRILFGHQSVGDNVLDGLEALAKEQGLALPSAQLSVAAPPAPGLTHFKVGENEQPLGKLEHFARVMEGTKGAVDVAMMKFCYVDFTDATDVKALFAAYQQTHEGLRAKFPNVQFVHVTVPLTVVQSGVRALLKRVTGSAPWGARENVKRHQFNELLRTTYGSTEPLVDLAAAESGTGASACSYEREGRRWPCLRPALTDDGGHLNAAGRHEVARAFLEGLSRALR